MSNVTKSTASIKDLRETPPLNPFDVHWDPRRLPTGKVYRPQPSYQEDLVRRAERHADRS